jgi:ABC-type methionine transport system ATPase subunit
VDRVHPAHRGSLYGNLSTTSTKGTHDCGITYHGKTVVHHLSLIVKTGEVEALIGPSGAGKSSLLRSINYLERPSAGKIQVAGQAVAADGRAPLPL